MQFPYEIKVKEMRTHVSDPQVTAAGCRHPASSSHHRPHSHQAHAATARPRPRFCVRIIHVSGAEGAKLQAIQAHAIREVLQWLHDHPAQTH